jgi:hypothetical protein
LSRRKRSTCLLVPEKLLAAIRQRPQISSAGSHHRTSEISENLYALPEGAIAQVARANFGAAPRARAGVRKEATKFLRAVVRGDDAIGDDRDEIGENPNASEALIDCELRLFIKLRLPRVLRDHCTKVGISLNLVEVDLSTSYEGEHRRSDAGRAIGAAKAGAAKAFAEKFGGASKYPESAGERASDARLGRCPASDAVGRHNPRCRPIAASQNADI